MHRFTTNSKLVCAFLLRESHPLSLFCCSVCTPFCPPEDKGKKKRCSAPLFFTYLELGMQTPFSLLSLFWMNGSSWVGGDKWFGDSTAFLFFSFSSSSIGWRRLLILLASSSFLREDSRQIGGLSVHTSPYFAALCRGFKKGGIPVLCKLNIFD